MNKEEEEAIQLRVPLKGEMKERFLKIKEKYGFESNTDLIRLLITQKYDELIRRKEIFG